MHQSPDSRFGLRFSVCWVGDFCLYIDVRNVKKLSIVPVTARMDKGVCEASIFQFKAV